MKARQLGSQDLFPLTVVIDVADSKELRKLLDFIDSETKDK